MAITSAFVAGFSSASKMDGPIEMLANFSIGRCFQKTLSCYNAEGTSTQPCFIIP